MVSISPACLRLGSMTCQTRCMLASLVFIMTLPVTHCMICISIVFCLFFVSALCRAFHPCISDSLYACLVVSIVFYHDALPCSLYALKRNLILMLRLFVVLYVSWQRISSSRRFVACLRLCVCARLVVSIVVLS